MVLKETGIQLAFDSKQTARYGLGFDHCHQVDRSWSNFGFGGNH